MPTLDTTDVEIYGRQKGAFNHQGSATDDRTWVATWAQTATVLAVELMAGNEDPRGHAAGLLHRALAALPARRGLGGSGCAPILPFHGFTIYADRDGDDPFVSVELVHNYVTVNDPTDIELYRDIYRRLTAAAATGSDAVALIQRVAAELRV